MKIIFFNFSFFILGMNYEPDTGLIRFICVNGLYLAVHNELRV